MLILLYKGVLARVLKMHRDKNRRQNRGEMFLVTQVAAQKGFVLLSIPFVHVSVESHSRSSC